ncbi:MAG: hypothetical protein IIB44_09985 [Candidatus Marinimicrobia bacterium]|nr:hypothetical protein [Candidatus Neomarinimicrobiota bacterium]
MISEEDKKIIRKCAKKYNVSKIILFGSALEEDDPNDIDLGVKGVAPGLFFKFYGELYMRMPKPVDLVDLSYKSLFNDIVEETGVVIYG